MLQLKKLIHLDDNPIIGQQHFQSLMESLLTSLTVMLKLMLNMCKPWHDCKTGSANAYSTEIDSHW